MRCVIHVDLDAFYAQVEQIRTKTPPNLPLAVQQWSAVIAVNYPARQHGVTRHLTVSECMQRCPELLLVHVATMSVDGVGDLEKEGKEGKEGEGEDGIRTYGAVNGVHQVDNKRSKASLEPYRRASKNIFAAIRQFFASFKAHGDKEKVVIEKASVDEAFIEIPLWLMEEYPCDSDTCQVVGVPIVKDCEYDAKEEQNVAIIKGTIISGALRKHVYKTLGFTMSAGIAKNKTLAKLASAKNKPDNQTYVMEEHVEPLMRLTPFSKIRFLGGKLGNSLRQRGGDDDEDDGEFDANGDVQYWTWTKPSEADPTAFELQQRTVEELTVRTGDRQSAEWIYNVIRGNDDSLVIDRSLVKSFMSAKQHRPPLNDPKLLLQWLRLFAVELQMRVMSEFEETARWPHTICLHYRRPNQTTKSKTTPLSLRHLQFTAANLFQYIHKHLVLKAADGELCPVNMVGVSVGKFMAVSALAGRAMDSFLQREAGCVMAPLFKQVPTGDDKAWKCSRCSQWFHAHQHEKIQEHQDHHMAMDLARGF